MGLYHSPTVLNNVETFASVPWIIKNGADAYSAIGTEKSKGTKLMSVSGHVNKPGVFVQAAVAPHAVGESHSLTSASHLRPL